MPPPKRILPVIVISQFCCASLWFAGNGVMNDLLTTFHLPSAALAHLTSAVQFGFITGTFTFALLTIADRFSPSKVFFVCAITGALVNLGVLWEQNNLASLFILRFLVGFFLAGIYPIGMKIAADYYEKGLGRSLSFLVGALVIATGFPHLLKAFTTSLPWRSVLMTTSCLAVLGGLLMFLLVPNGPHRKPGQQLNLSVIFTVFKNVKLRSAAFGYFGHMWELYAFWAFVPVILTTYTALHPGITFNIPVFSFLIIGIGGISCFIGGYLSQSFGEKRIASIALFFSGLCCVISPLMFFIPSGIVFILFLLFWGMMITADSPLFSTLVAKNALAETKGTSLTIVNCIGFSITIVSIQLLNLLITSMDARYIYTVLAIGPALGLIALYRKK